MAIKAAVQQQREGGDPGYGGRAEQGQSAEYGSIIFNLSSALSMVTGRIMNVPEQKKVVMSSIGLILQDPRVTVNRTLLPINHLVLRWVTSGKVQNSKEIKEVVTLMSNLVKVQMKVANSTNRFALEDERGLLKLLLFLCDPSEDKNQRVNATLRKDIFEKVERSFLIGLRSRTPSTRRAFFRLHHSTVGQSLFDRLAVHDKPGALAVAGGH